MARAPRTLTVVPDGLYHVIARGNNKMKIFHDEEDYSAYLGFLSDGIEKHRTVIYHYVIMPNHVHMLIKPVGSLPAFMQSVQMRYAKHYCRKYKHFGHVWQGRYKSPIIASDAHLFACGNYIEMNPVRAGLVLKPEAWPYTSYRLYAFGLKDAFTTIDPFYPTIGRNPEERRQNYRNIIAKTRAGTMMPV